MDKKFKFFNWGLPVRLIGTALFWTLGVAIQVTYPDLWFLGYFALILGAGPLILKNISNKPSDQGKEEWRPVTMAEVDRLRDALTQSNKLKSKFGSQGCLLFALVAIVVLGIFISLDEDPALGTFFLDSGVFLLAGLVGGRVQVFYPTELGMKMQAFTPLVEFKPGEDRVVTPYLRFDVDEKGQDIPEDIRFLLEPKRRPKDFLGVQFQAAINNGPNGAVPYIYGVFITQGLNGPTSKALGVPNIPGYVVEKGGDENWGSLVVRQETSGTGYATGPTEVEDLVKICNDLVTRIS